MALANRINKFWKETMYCDVAYTGISDLHLIKDVNTVPAVHFFIRLPVGFKLHFPLQHTVIQYQ
jgi:hypothetical protein